MARINLLPWRAERRKLREREFYIQLGIAFAAAVFVLLAWSFWMDARISNQGERNTYLQDEIKQLDSRIAKIKDLEKVRSSLLQRKQIIEQLQANRSQMVHLFDEMVKTVPGSARLTGMKQSGDALSLDGVSQSNTSVADYMRNIEASPWMGHVDLRKTENTHDASRMPYTFGLDVRLSKPGTDASDPNAAGGAPLVPASAASTAPAAVPAAIAGPVAGMVKPTAPVAAPPAAGAASAAPATPTIAPVAAPRPTPAATVGAKP
ncbi:type IV pilus assembly protein PilN [Luteibacter rhizovicinus]|uniref:Type IV pilus assembly protein PilN n=1 Tax=Luteibacter rhizovicinus TaxID=242606 RepID=A0A4R3YSP1_9GAMM|nr:PilN domain-containing protein [Luteibacter rhizovicinus]TCV96015.1 type IV pilus assembly protein PilN [Luteibacter rhizovicinus]